MEFLKSHLTRRELLTKSTVLFLRSKQVPLQETTTSTETSSYTRLLSEAAASIEQTGMYQTELSESDIVQLASSLANERLKNGSLVSGTVEKLSVHIDDTSLSAQGDIHMSDPISGDISVEGQFIQTATEEPVLTSIKVDAQGSLAKRIAIDAALELIDLEGKAKEKLEHPYNALLGYLEDPLRAYNIYPTHINLEFTEAKTMKLSLQGEKILPSTPVAS